MIFINRLVKIRSSALGGGGGDGLTRPTPGDGNADQLRGVPIIGQPPGTRPEVQNRKGVAEDGQTYRVKCRAVKHDLKDVLRFRPQ